MMKNNYLNYNRIITYEDFKDINDECVVFDDSNADGC